MKLSSTPIHCRYCGSVVRVSMVDDDKVTIEATQNLPKPSVALMWLHRPDEPAFAGKVVHRCEHGIEVVE